jgi:predicted methyltransferase
MLRLVEYAHQKVAEVLAPGDTCIDATAGNGYDTLFLAKQVAPGGKVYAFDIQEDAIRATQARLTVSQLEELAVLIPCCHSMVRQSIPSHLHGQIAAATFNLGYLPGGDHALCTTPPKTVEAIHGCHELLKPGGHLSILCYRGHMGGPEEAVAVKHCLKEAGWAMEETPGGTGEHSPIHFLVKKAA